MIAHNNLYDPVMYLINNSIKRHFNGPGGSSGDPYTPYIEGVTLSRDSRGRLASVNGWEYIDYTLNYSPTLGILDSVDIVHRLTGKHLHIGMVYDDKRLLVEVIPEILDPGTGEPGKMNVVNVTEDYNQVAP